MRAYINLSNNSVSDRPAGTSTTLTESRGDNQTIEALFHRDGRIVDLGVRSSVIVSSNEDGKIYCPGHSFTDGDMVNVSVHASKPLKITSSTPSLEFPNETRLSTYPIPHGFTATDYSSDVDGDTAAGTYRVVTQGIAELGSKQAMFQYGYWSADDHCYVLFLGPEEVALMEKQGYPNEGDVFTLTANNAGGMSGERYKVTQRGHVLAGAGGTTYGFWIFFEAVQANCPATITSGTMTFAETRLNGVHTATYIDAYTISIPIVSGVAVQNGQFASAIGLGTGAESINTGGMGQITCTSTVPAIFGEHEVVNAIDDYFELDGIGALSLSGDSGIASIYDAVDLNFSAKAKASFDGPEVASASNFTAHTDALGLRYYSSVIDWETSPLNSLFGIQSFVTLSGTSNAGGDYIETTSAHGLTVGDRVTLAGTLPAGLIVGAIYHVLTVPTSVRLTLAATAAGSLIAIDSNLTFSVTGYHDSEDKASVSLGGEFRWSGLYASHSKVFDLEIKNTLYRDGSPQVGSLFGSARKLIEVADSTARKALVANQTHSNGCLVREIGSAGAGVTVVTCPADTEVTAGIPLEFTIEYNTNTGSQSVFSNETSASYLSICTNKTSYYYLNVVLISSINTLPADYVTYLFGYDGTTPEFRILGVLIENNDTGIQVATKVRNAINAESLYLDHTEFTITQAGSTLTFTGTSAGDNFGQSYAEFYDAGVYTVEQSEVLYEGSLDGAYFDIPNSRDLRTRVSFAGGVYSIPRKNVYGGANLPVYTDSSCVMPYFGTPRTAAQIASALAARLMEYDSDFTATASGNAVTISLPVGNLRVADWVTTDTGSSWTGFNISSTCHLGSSAGLTYMLIDQTKIDQDAGWMETGNAVAMLAKRPPDDLTHNTPGSSPWTTIPPYGIYVNNEVPTVLPMTLRVTDSHMQYDPYNFEMRCKIPGLYAFSMGVDVSSLNPIFCRKMARFEAKAVGAGSYSVVAMLKDQNAQLPALENIANFTLTSVTGASPSVFTTSAAHGLVQYSWVNLGSFTTVGGSPQTISGMYMVASAPTSTTFTVYSLAGLQVTAGGGISTVLALTNGKTGMSVTCMAYLKSGIVASYNIGSDDFTTGTFLHRMNAGDLMRATYEVHSVQRAVMVLSNPLLTNFSAVRVSP